MTRLAEGRRLFAREGERLRRLDRAIALVEESLRSAPADDAGLSRVADVLGMEDETTQMKRYFSDDAWDVAKRFYESWPSAEWIALGRDFAATVHENDDSERAGNLVRRWNDLARAFWSTVPADRHLSRQLHEGFARAWRDRQNWSNALKRRFSDYHVEEMAAFIGRASAVRLARGTNHELGPGPSSPN